MQHNQKKIVSLQHETKIRRLVFRCSKIHINSSIAVLDVYRYEKSLGF